MQNTLKGRLDNYIIINLREPYWGAWKKYGWEEGIEGFGVRESLINVARMSKKKLLISFKYGDYEITPTLAEKVVKKYKSIFIARDNTKLVVIPRNRCKKVNLDGSK